MEPVEDVPKRTVGRHVQPRGTDVKKRTSEGADRPNVAATILAACRAMTSTSTALRRAGSPSSPRSSRSSRRAAGIAQLLPRAGSSTAAASTPAPTASPSAPTSVAPTSSPRPASRAPTRSRRRPVLRPAGARARTPTIRRRDLLPHRGPGPAIRGLPPKSPVEPAIFDQTALDQRRGAVRQGQPGPVHRRHRAGRPGPRPDPGRTPRSGTSSSSCCPARSSASTTTTKQMYVVTGAARSGRRGVTFAHEFTHALQDQTFDLGASGNATDQTRPRPRPARADRGRCHAAR